MKSVARMELQPGMVLGEDIMHQGNVLYKTDTVLDQAAIDKLKRYSIMCVTIKEGIDLATTHYERVRYNEHFKKFEQKHSTNLYRYKQLMTDFLAADGGFIPDGELLILYNDLRSTYNTGTTLLDFLYNLMPNEDELTYNHCLNAALLAGIFAEWIQMNQEDKEILILSCFYYDIGKLKLPYEILWKSGKLTPEELAVVQKHPALGYQLLNNTSVNQRIKNVTAMHHERMDGSGYPFHTKGNKIDVFARYVAIIDTYIAMASPRSYRSAMTPLQILDSFAETREKYDAELLLPLMKRISDAQLGTSVQLSDESVWEVFMIHANKYSRPVLKNEENQLLDLLKHPELEIVKNV